MKKLVLFLTLVLCSALSMADNNKILYTTVNNEALPLYDGATFGANVVSNTYENGQGVITFDGDVTKIGASAFSEKSPEALATIILPKSVLYIDYSAFWGCENLTSIDIPTSVFDIGNTAFKNCKKLSSITIPEGVSSIYKETFSGCEALATVSLPSSIVEINEKAFDGCRRLTTVYCAAVNVPEVASNAFPLQISSNATLYVPEESLSAYKRNSEWSMFSRIQVFDPSGIHPIISEYNQSAIYDLSGKLLTSPQKGVNIINGKKVVME